MYERTAVTFRDLIICCSCAFALACNQQPHEGVATGSECEEGVALDYETFGRDFMQRYCVECHSSALSPEARNGAPTDHDFDTLSAIQHAHMAHIDHEAAAGPSGINKSMPPEGFAQPSVAERRELGRWLACGAP